MSSLATWASLALAFFIAGFIVAIALRTSWRRAGAWLALALASRGAVLALYQAGPTVTYHHLRPHGDPWMLEIAAVVLVAQALFVAIGMRHGLRDMRTWMAEHLGPWRAAAIALAVLAVSAKISRPAQQSVQEFVLATTLELITLINLVLFARALPDGALAWFDGALDRWLGRASDVPEPGRTDRFALVLALVSVLVAALLNVFVYERHPHVPDEVVYLLHARYLAEGMLSLPPPRVPEAFDLDLMLLDQGRWYCPVPVGWPLALAVGAFFGVPWLVNPVLGGLAILATYAFVRELASRRTARVVCVLLAASPWFVFLNMSFMTHSWTLVCAVVAALGVARSRRTGSLAWVLLGGACIGMVALIRPLEGAVLALALGLWSIGIGGARLKLSRIATLVLATAAVGALNLPYNARLTGNPSLFPIQRYVDVLYGPGKNDMGFGPDKGLDWGGLDPWPGHTPFQALVNAQFNGFAIDAELFGWSIGSLALVWLALFASRWSRTDKLMLVFIAAIVVSNSFYWFSGGPDFGARYWYLVIVPLVWLSVSGLRALESKVREPARVRAFVAALVVIAWTTWIPWRGLDKYLDYRGMSPDIWLWIPQTPFARTQFGRSLVLVGGERFPHYASAAVFNPLDLDADAPIYAWDRDPQTRAKLLEHYADRNVWYLEYGIDCRLCGAGLCVLPDGPIPASEVTPDWHADSRHKH